METVANVCAHGAQGDGVADDSNAVSACLASLGPRGGIVFFPPGHYRLNVTAIPDFVTVQGVGGWSYREPGSTIISPVHDHQECIFTLHNNRGGRLKSLSLDGENRGGAMHAVMASKDRRRKKMEQNFVLDDVLVTRFSGCGLHMETCHVWCVRHSNFQFIGCDGIRAGNSCDGWVIDNQIGHCGRYGVELGSSVVVTGNRIEQNGEAGIRFSPDYVENTVLTGNHFCSERGPAVDIRGAEGKQRIRGITLTGNLMRNSARRVETGDETRNCHIRMDNVRGVACTGNVLHVLRANLTPEVCIFMRNCTECTVTGNVMHHGAMKELIRDVGGNQGCVVTNNTGSLKDPTDDDS